MRNIVFSPLCTPPPGTIKLIKKVIQHLYSKTLFLSHSAWSESWGACRRRYQFRGAKSAKFHWDTPFLFASEQIRMSILSVQKFWAKKQLIILRNSAKHIWPSLHNSKVPEKRILTSGVMLDTPSQNAFVSWSLFTWGTVSLRRASSSVGYDLKYFMFTLMLFACCNNDWMVCGI